MDALPVTLKIDGLPVTVPSGTTIYDAARKNGIRIPVLCHQQDQRPVGVCRVCCVDTGERILPAACVRSAENGMDVQTNSERARQSRRTLLELLMSDHASPCARQRQSADCELEVLAAAENVKQVRYPKRTSLRGLDDSSLVIAVDHDACIMCERCIRGCDETKKNNVIGRTGKGYLAGISFDLDQPIGQSSCVSCGECMVSCPTGALTNKGVFQAALPDGDAIDMEIVQRLPYFQGISGTFLNLNKNAIVLRHFKAGEVICREGEYGSTAFFIIKGKAEIYLESPMAHVKTKGGATGFFSKLTSYLSKSPGKKELEQRVGSIPIDASVDLPLDLPTAMLGPGDFFGEMTCLSSYPRSATVRAADDCVMLEMLRNVLDMMMRNKTFRAELDGKYRSRALDDHLRSVPLFSSLDQDFVDLLRKKVDLHRYEPGQVISRQNDRADRMHLIRAGFVKLTERRRGGDSVVAYLGKGEHFGEIALLGKGVQTETATATDHVELVSIRAAEFEAMVSRFPEIRKRLHEEMEDRQEQNRSRHASDKHLSLDLFVDQGLMQANSLLLLDLEKCTRCDACVRACADAHDGVTRLIREGVRFDKYLVATSCRHCRDPLCMVGCPVGSIRRRNSLEVVIENWCIGCGLCAENCPYGNINMHPFTFQEKDPESPGGSRAVVKQKATSCDLCMEHAEPSCVYACPHDAAHRVDPNEFFKISLTKK